MKIILLTLLALLTVRILTTTIHELGHALPALLFSRQKVNIYIGSYGDPTKSWVLKWGRLTAFFRYDLTRWDMGMCSHSQIKNIGQSLLVVLGGPLFSLLFGLSLVFWIRANDFPEETIFLLAFFIVSALWDFLVNILPNSQASYLHDGTLLYNDGFQLKQLWQMGQLPEEYFKGMEALGQEDLEEAKQYFEKTIDQGNHSRELYRRLAEVGRKQKDGETILKSYADMLAHHPLESRDMIEIGELYFEKGDHHEAIKYFSRSLYLDYKNAQTLFLRGRAYLQLGEYQKALADFKTAIAYRPDYASAYNYGGLVLLRLREKEAALKMIEKARQLDGSDPEVYLHLGFYYSESKEAQLALDNFLEAQNRGSDHHGLALFIAEERGRLPG